MKNFESTYALLVRSEDTKQSRLEMVIYFVLVLCATASIWQFAQQSVVLPTDRIVGTSRVVHTHRG